jgi:hypothetical protein
MSQASAQQAEAARADIARQQAGGLMSGAQASKNLQGISRTQASQDAQNQASVQAQSNQAAKAQYASDQGVIAGQAAHTQQLIQGLGSDAMQYAGLKAKYGADAQASLDNNLAGMNEEEQKRFLKMRAVGGYGRVDQPAAKS